MPQNEAENERFSRTPVLRTVLTNMFKAVFRGETVTNPPWPRMILCAVATLVPLIAGVLRNEVGAAIFGGLTGYLLALNDHMGTLKHRLWVTTLSALIIVIGFGLGQHFQNNSTAYVIVLGLVAYWLGLLGGEGAELERAVLFSLIGYITAFSTPAITEAVLGGLFFYSCLAYLCLMIGAPIVFLLGRREAADYAGLRQSLRISLTLKSERHLHAFTFGLTVLFSVWFARNFEVDHGSWITVTVLIVLRPDRMLTVYKTLQRFFGTLFGVLVADLIVLVHPPIWAILIGCAVCAFTIPWAMLKNYWLTSFFVTVFVVLLLEISTGQQAGLHVGTLRIEATTIGCSMSVLGVGLARALDRILKSLRISA